MKRLLLSIAAAIPALLRDAVGIGGGVLAAYGVWTIYRPAGMIVGGALMMAAALLLSRGAR